MGQASERAPTCIARECETYVALTPDSRRITILTPYYNTHAGLTPYSTGDAYGQSKLAQVMMTRELALRLPSSQTVTVACHPGAVVSGLLRHTPVARSLPDWVLNGSINYIPTEAGASPSPLRLASVGPFRFCVVRGVWS